MFGVIKGKAVPRKSVRTRKLLNSLFEPERPVMRSIASDFCERDALDLNGESLVHWCCRQDDMVKLQQLIVDNYSLHFRNKKGETPLHVCCFAGSDECCAVLLQHTSSDVNCLDNDGWSPLHWAVEQNHLECVKILLTHKADVNLRLPSGKTPLELAVQTDPFAKEMMAVLLEQEQTGKVVLKSTGLSKAFHKFEKLALPGDQLHAEETVKCSLAKQLFECADKDGSGSLNKEEFKKALKDLMGMEHLKSKLVTLLNARALRLALSLPAFLSNARTRAQRAHARAHNSLKYAACFSNTPAYTGRSNFSTIG
jgi:ankyrin repeat protein